MSSHKQRNSNTTNHRPGCRSHTCDLRVDRIWGRTHRPKGTHHFAESTCYHEGSITASGSGVYVGEVASNELPLGTHVRLDHAVFGRRDFVVLDRIGYGSQFDVYGPSEADCLAYGRQTLGFWTVP